MHYESPYGTLAKILTSRHVGLSHIRLVGEVVVAQARLDEWLYRRGKAVLPTAEWAELIQRALEIERRYKAAWEVLESCPTDADKRRELPNLGEALNGAAARFRLVREELVDRFGDDGTDSQSGADSQSTAAATRRADAVGAGAVGTVHFDVK